MDKFHKKIPSWLMFETIENRKKEQTEIVKEIIKNEKGAEIIKNEENKIKMYVNAIILYYFYDVRRSNKTKNNHLKLEEFWNEVVFTEDEKKEIEQFSELEKINPKDPKLERINKNYHEKYYKFCMVCSDVDTSNVGELPGYISENVKLEVLKVIYNYLENNYFEYEGKLKKLAKKFKPKWLLNNK